jgi:hypothetical protein
MLCLLIHPVVGRAHTYKFVLWLVMDRTSIRITFRRKDGSSHVTTIRNGDSAVDVSRRLEVRLLARLAAKISTTMELVFGVSWLAAHAP